MEKVKSKAWIIDDYTNLDSLYKKIVFTLLKRFKKGKLVIKLPDQEFVMVGDYDRTDFAEITLHDDSFYKRIVLGGDIAFGEMYVDQTWDSPDLTKVIEFMIENVETAGVMSGTKSKFAAINLMGVVNRLAHLKRKNTIKGSRDNISFHYDLSNDFYSSWLDETMTYSSAVFSDEATDLKQAQIQKYDLLCQDLALKESDHVLEVGCGWGGFMEHAVLKYGVRYTGVTISKEQLKFAQARAEKLGVTDRVELKFCDYRKIEGQFDKIVSIEMIEAVGDEFLPVYFEKLQSLVKPQGLLSIQAITCVDSRYDEYRRSVDWIQKYIFPGALLPSVAKMIECVSKTGDMHLVKFRDIGLHYGKTLKIWDERFLAAWDQIRTLGFDEKFKRQWHYYLCYCEAAFNQRNISDVQITWSRPNNLSY